MIFRDSLNAPFRPIAVAEVPAGTARQTYETAAWFQDITYGEQEVIVYSNGYYVKWTVTGTVTDANFQSLYGGVAVGKPYDKARDIGNVASYTFMPYAYGFAEKVMDGGYVNEGFMFHFLPEYGVGCAPYQHDPSKTGYFLTMPEAGHPLEVAMRPSTGFDDKHVYRVTFRGQQRANIIVKRSEGFNGDTRNVAYQRASVALEEEGAFL